jgi:uncharacterized phage infection (PIP) family protein YhgE
MTLLLSLILSVSVVASATAAAADEKKTPANEIEARTAFDRKEFGVACAYFAANAKSARGHALAASCFYWWGQEDASKLEKAAVEWALAKAACPKSSQCEKKVALYQDATTSVIKSSQTITELESKKATLESEVHTLDEALETSNSDLKKLDEALSTAESELGLPAADGATADDRAAKVKEKINELKKQRDTLAEKNKKLRDEAKKTQAELKGWKERALKAEKESAEWKKKYLQLLMQYGGSATVS